MKFYIILILCNFLFAINGISQSTSKKTIIYDWNKGFTKSFPFDELFQIEIQNMPSDVKSVQLIIKQSDKKYIEEAKLNSDTTYFEGLHAGMELSFTDKNLTRPTYHLLTPNNYYLVELKIKQKQKIADEEKQKLKEQIKNNPDFNKEVFSKFSQIDFFKLNADTFNAVIYRHIKSINPAYEVDQKTLPVNKADIQISIVNAGAALISIGQNIFDLRNNVLNKKYSFSDKKLNNLDDLIIHYEKSNFYVPIITTDFKDYVQKLNDIKASYDPKSDSAAIADFNFVLNNSIRPNFDAFKAAIDNWIMTVENLININIESSYIILTLGSTIADDEDTRASIYISQSVGGGYSIRTGNTPTYLAYSFFFRPVNQEVPLNVYKKSDWWKVRLCLNAGFTFNNITTNRNGIVSGTLGDKAIILGAGFRIWSFLKLDANGLVYYLNDPNPLVKHKHINCSPLLGLSLNINIAKLLAGKPNPLSDLQELFK